MNKIKIILITLMLLSTSAYSQMTFNGMTLNGVSTHTDVIQIMFFGDSISTGSGSTPAVGWYPELETALTIGDFEYVGDVPNVEGATTFYHCAWGGQRNVYILAEVPNCMKYFGTSERKIAFILPSTNDIGSSAGCNAICAAECSDAQEEAVADATIAIVNAIQAIDPTVDVIVSTILKRHADHVNCNDDVLPEAQGGEAGTNVNDYIQIKVEGHANFGTTVFFTDLQNTAPAFDPTTMLADVVHPNNAGFTNLVTKIANAIN